jgi:hypothetical protein
MDGGELSRVAILYFIQLALVSSLRTSELPSPLPLPLCWGAEVLHGWRERGGCAPMGRDVSSTSSLQTPQNTFTRSNVTHHPHKHPFHRHSFAWKRQIDMRWCGTGRMQAPCC